jgi:hypothetical protein
MFETYRMLGEQHEAELRRVAERANAGQSGGARQRSPRGILSLVIGPIASRLTAQTELAGRSEPERPTP